MTCTSLPPSLSLAMQSLSFVTLVHPSHRHDRNTERSQLSAAGDFPPLGFCDLSSSLSISISMPLHWHHSWTILAEHQKPLSPSIPLFFSLPFTSLLWISLKFRSEFRRYYLASDHSLLNKVSLLLYLVPPPSVFSFDVVKPSFSQACSVLSLSHSVSQFSISMCFRVSESVNQWQQVCSVYTPSGPTSPPRQTEGNLHCLCTSTTMFISCFGSTVLTCFPEFIITCNGDITLWCFCPQKLTVGFTHPGGGGSLEELVYPQSRALVSRLVSNLLQLRHKLFWYDWGREGISSVM